MTTLVGAVSATPSSGPVEPAAKKQKLGGYDFYRSIGSPRYVVAPMVDQSELAWRLLSKSPLPDDLAGPSTTITPTPGGPIYTRYPGGAHLCYTPMIHAKVFSTSKPGSKGTDGQFDLLCGEEGSDQVLAGIKGGDRPLFVQFCANDPDVLLAAAKMVEAHCDAVDINFGCPQGIAKRGNYGSFLQDDWKLISSLIGTLHKNLSIPVTAKFRIHPSLERTLAYARMMEAAGAQILTVHGRTREMKGQHTGLADWDIIRQVKQAVKVPVFANGNILYAEDVERCLEATGCDGVMSAEGNLSNPAIFLPSSHPHAYPPVTTLARRYLDIVAALKTPTGNSAIKSHLFRLFKPYLDAQPTEEMRTRIGRSWTMDDFRRLVDDIEADIKPLMDMPGATDITPLDKDGYRTLPVWRAQPYIRSSPRSTESAVDENGSVIPSSANGTAIPSRVSTPPPGAAPTEISLVGAVSANGQPKANHNPICAFPGCKAIPASRCPHQSCLIHCRATSAVASAQDGSGGKISVEEAAAEAAKGGLEGRGCEPHEEKIRARKERMEQKRKHRAEGKRERKVRKMGAERSARDRVGDGEDSEAEGSAVAS